MRLALARTLISGSTLALGVASLQAAPLSVKVTDARGQPLAGAVVAVEGKALSSRAKPGTQAELAQKDRQFRPQLLVIQTGTEVRFPNEDPVRHHVYSYSAPKTFELKLYLGQPSNPVLFDKPGVVPVGCNIHDRMAAHIVVVDTPLFAITDAQGLARLELPAQSGALQLRSWHPSRAEALAQTQTIPAGATQVTAALP